MKIKARYIILFVAISMVVLSIAVYLLIKPSQTASTRPPCVTLPMYSSVIEQVMNIQPSWEPLAQTNEGYQYQYQWAIQDDTGNHKLSATLTSDGCICATNASSHFNMGSGKEDMAGLFQGAAVAPVSDLDYTTTWLEPRLFFSCGAAYLFHKPYNVKTIMQDGTLWELACSRLANSNTYDSLYTLTVVSTSCFNIPE